MKHRVALVGPVFPYRAGIAYCTSKLADELRSRNELTLVSFRRQFPQRFYPGGSDIDPTLESLRPADASFDLDVVNPFTWIAAGLRLRRARLDTIVLVWWIWVWALPYLIILLLQRKETKVVLQCHNIGDKEPSRWKSALTNAVLRRANVLVVHAKSEADEARRRTKERVKIVTTFLPVHELGSGRVERQQAREQLGLSGNVALCFGHVRPFKAVDVAIEAVARCAARVTLVVAGEVWFDQEQLYREQVARLDVADRVRLEFRFIPDAEIALWFAAADVVLTPYRREAQSGVAMTAFHFRRPVIASNVGGFPEIVEEGATGFLIPPDDADALASAIDLFFSSTEREAMERAAADAAAKYSWTEYGSVIEREL